MKITSVELTHVGVTLHQYPDNNNIEVAFIGRSNVGKSSLINTMINRKALARTSSAPGKTRTINFYDINKSFYLVDLPGYGYAKTSKDENKRMGRLVETYLIKREQLKKVSLLIDVRHNISENDIMMYEFLKYYNIDIIIVANKFDKLNVNERDKKLLNIKNSLKLDENTAIVPFSSLAKTGRDELWNEILSGLNI